MSWGVVIFVALIGLIPAKIAERKGGSFIAWWIFGAALWIVALPPALMKKDDRYGSCPHCGEDIRTMATVCPHCQRDVTPAQRRRRA